MQISVTWRLTQLKRNVQHKRPSMFSAYTKRNVQHKRPSVFSVYTKRNVQHKHPSLFSVYTKTPIPQRNNWGSHDAVITCALLFTKQWPSLNTQRYLNALPTVQRTVHITFLTATLHKIQCSMSHWTEGRLYARPIAWLVAEGKASEWHQQLT